MKKPSSTSDRWWDQPLSTLDAGQWEALCDGCGRCCLHKLEDEETGELFPTNVACKRLDRKSGRCTDYANRSQRVPDCVTITPAVLEDPYWLPRTCAYRLIAEGQDLPAWHPLRTGDPQSVVRAGHRVCDRTICEDEADELESHLVDWIE